MPVGSASTRYLINEIVTGEESDVDMYGHRISHFELYLQAMEQMESSTLPAKDFLQQLSAGHDVLESIKRSTLSAPLKQFLQYTFTIIRHGGVHEIAAVFTYGREDLIPEMFIGLVKQLDMAHPEKLTIFKYYLERHIEVDGDHHGVLARQMVAELCGHDEKRWEEAARAANGAIESRIVLWDEISRLLSNRAV